MPIDVQDAGMDTVVNLKGVLEAVTAMQRQDVEAWETTDRPLASCRPSRYRSPIGVQ